MRNLLFVFGEQHAHGRKVSWGVKLGDASALFTHVSVPVMTRLKQPERRVLDTLVDAGVARSRSEALAWAVKLVGRHTESWLAELRTAMEQVDKLRAQGPGRVEGALCEVEHERDGIHGTNATPPLQRLPMLTP